MKMLFVDALISEYNYACSAPHCSGIGKGGRGGGGGHSIKTVILVHTVLLLGY